MEIRNIAIIAHVDHGKTTLLDNMLKQSGTLQDHQDLGERVMDKNTLEKERGITILAKCTSILWQNSKINIIDTPGHADFGGEVERVLSMADSVLLLVDSAEGPMPQTKFVLSKALKAGLKPIVIINKIDRSDARVEEVLDEIMELFINLDADDDQLEFPTLYASGRNGWCMYELENKRKNLTPLFETIMKHVKPAESDDNAPFSMLVTLLESDPFLGRVLTGKIYKGKACANMEVKAIDLNGNVVEKGKLTKLQSFSGLNRISVDEAKSGDIIAIAGMKKCSVADTIASPIVEKPISSTPIDPSTMAITVSVNTSPLAGKEGTKLTSRMIRDRLMYEAETNVAVRVKEIESSDAFEVAGRGELQLGVLIETMRREGFELSVSRPKVLLRHENKEKLEPIEEVIVDIDEEFSGVVMEKLSSRKGEMQSMDTVNGRTRLIYLIPSRGLIGYQGEFLTDSRGTGIMNRLFHSYGKFRGNFDNRRNGALISMNAGEAVAYAIFNLQDRGVMFVKPQDKVYSGMIIGQHNRENDLEVNLLKGKQLTNMRAAGSDEAVKLSPPQVMTLEEMISYINDDELVEVTPDSLRLRKAILDSNERKRSKKVK
ncbi:MAG: translational GTPase TypA [Rickettsiaceae bacterium H1]|nr:translational GTPase TypA [Rickettsiaceae bacterium H1]